MNYDVIHYLGRDTFMFSSLSFWYCVCVHLYTEHQTICHWSVKATAGLLHANDVDVKEKMQTHWIWNTWPLSTKEALRRLLFGPKTHLWWKHAAWFALIYICSISQCQGGRDSVLRWCDTPFASWEPSLCLTHKHRKLKETHLNQGVAWKFCSW